MDSAADRPRYVPFDGRGQSISMGLRPLALDAWLEPDSRRDAELAAKAELLATRHAEVVATLPLGDDGARETFVLVLEEVRRRSLSTEAEIAAQEAAVAGGRHPVDAAGRLVQEDLCVMVRDPASGLWVLGAASVCSPSRWRLADKIGRSVAEIHGPVPDYARIARATDQFFDRISEDRPVWRTNWTLLDDPAPFQPGAPLAGSASSPPFYLRVERQTLRRLPRSGAVLFTIRTYVDPLEALSQAAQADLAATLEEVDPGLVAYRGWSDLLPAVREQLARG